MNIVPDGILTINELMRYDQDNKLIINKEYQRSKVWRLLKKQQLIDSIIKGYTIGMVFLRETEDKKFEILDGQQRLEALFEFIGFRGENNVFSTNAEFTPEFGDKTYEDIKNDPRRYADFIAFKVPYTLIRDSDDEITADVFLRLQEGMPLNTAEKLNAMRGKIRNEILDLSNHTLLHRTTLSDKRFGLRLLCAQICMLELKSDLVNLTFPDIKYKNLRDIYKQYKNQEPPQWLIPKVKRIFNTIERSLENKASLISKRGDFIPIYLLFSYLDKKFVVDTNVEQKLRNFVVDFVVRINGINLKQQRFQPEDIPYKEYKEARSTGALSSKSFKKRFDMILTMALEYMPDLTLKDTIREFDYGQRLAIYQRDQEICKEIKKSVFTA